MANLCEVLAGETAAITVRAAPSLTSPFLRHLIQGVVDSPPTAREEPCLLSYTGTRTRLTTHTSPGWGVEPRGT